MKASEAARILGLLAARNPNIPSIVFLTAKMFIQTRVQSCYMV